MKLSRQKELLRLTGFVLAEIGTEPLLPPTHLSTPQALGLPRGAKEAAPRRARDAHGHRAMLSFSWSVRKQHLSALTELPVTLLPFPCSSPWYKLSPGEGRILDHEDLNTKPCPTNSPSLWMKNLEHESFLKTYFKRDSRQLTQLKNQLKKPHNSIHTTEKR